MKDNTTECRDTIYKHNALPAQITRTLFITYGVGRWNAGQIRVWDIDVSENGSDYVLIAGAQTTIAIPEKQDIKGKLFEVLKAELEQVRAENYKREREVQEKIDNLLAITYESGEAA